MAVLDSILKDNKYFFQLDLSKNRIMNEGAQYIAEIIEKNDTLA